MKKLNILICCLLTIVFSLYGCVEARLWLSDQSRFPKWFIMPEGKNRNDFSMKMESHSTLTGGKIIFKVYEKDSIVPFQKYEIVTNSQNDMLPLQSKSAKKGAPVGFPKYIITIVNGITDIAEQRQMEPVFYMTDDPVVWKEFGVD